MFQAVRSRLSREVDAASLYAFRVLFGGVMAASAARFMWNGWVDRLFGERTFFFKYWGFSWLSPLPVAGMYGVYTALLALGIAIALGFYYRIAIVAFFILFSYAELTDVTNYLNHYYLVSLLALLMAFSPLSAGFSLDAAAGRVRPADTLPTYTLWLFRFQIVLVYFFAALAKCGPDWLLHGWPLNGWLLAQSDVPLLGRALMQPNAALIASWGGMLHDFLVPPLLLWRRTRGYAFAALVFFHAVTSTWFNIGIFPVLMPMAATLFFEPDWPRRWLSRLSPFGRPASAPARSLLSPAGASLVACYCAVQLLVPLRCYVYGGNVLWHEQGMRFSWRVMLRDKRGSVMYRLAMPNGRTLRVSPRRYLSSEQEREMAGQPDLVLQLAQHIAADYAQRGAPLRAIYADADVSLNGRTPHPMIDPTVDLLRVHDGLARATYVLSAPEEAPPHLHAANRFAWKIR